MHGWVDEPLRLLRTEKSEEEDDGVSYASSAIQARGIEDV